MGEVNLVPQLGGRLMPVSFNGHPYLFVNEVYKGELRCSGRGCGPLDQLWWRQDFALARRQ